MAKTAFRGTPVNTVGQLPALGQTLPAFELVGGDLAPVRLADFAGEAVVLNIFPSIDTGVCATSVRQFNQRAAGLDGVKVLCVSADLPFAQGRFCGAEGIDNVVVASAFRSDFGQVTGLEMADGPLAGLLARAVIVVAADGRVAYTQLVAEIANEPDYDAALAAAGAATA